MTRDSIQQDMPRCEPASARYYCLAAELRRAAMWAICGCVLIVPVACCVGVAAQRDPAGLVILVIMFISGAIWLSQFFLSRVKIDNAGIHRRILWWWDLWPWESFVTGQVRDGAALHSYHEPSRAWWRRKLQLGFLEEVDAKEIDALIRRVWVPPAPEPLPGMVELKINWPDRRVVRLTRERLVISKGEKITDYRWDEVVGATVWRLSHDRTDFRELHLEFPDQNLTLRRFQHQGEDCMTWRGASAEMIAGFVCQQLDPGRLQDFSLHDAPQSLRELDARQKQDQLKSQQSLIVMKWVNCLAWGLLAVTPFLLPWPKGVIMAGMYAPLAAAKQWFYRDTVRKHEKRQQEFDEQRQEMVGSA